MVSSSDEAGTSYIESKFLAVGRAADKAWRVVGHLLYFLLTISGVWWNTASVSTACVCARAAKKSNGVLGQLCMGVGNRDKDVFIDLLFLPSP